MVVETNEKLEVILKSRKEAELVLERMRELLIQFGTITVRDVKELVALPFVYLDEKLGWTNLDSAEIKQVRTGYLLLLPLGEELQKTNQLISQDEIIKINRNFSCVHVVNKELMLDVWYVLVKREDEVVWEIYCGPLNQKEAKEISNALNSADRTTNQLEAEYTGQPKIFGNFRGE